MSQPWKNVPLGDLLTHEQINDVVKIMNSTPDDLELTGKLKAYLLPLRQELRAKGVLDEYLAYVLLAMRDQLVARSGGHNPANN